MSVPVGMFVDDGDVVPTHCSGLTGYDDVATSDEVLLSDEELFVEDGVAASALASLAAGVLSPFFLLASVVAPSVLAEVSAACDLLPDRESVLYHPEPLKTIPAGWKIRRMAALHSGHVVRGVSENF